MISNSISGLSNSLENLSLTNDASSAILSSQQEVLDEEEEALLNSLFLNFDFSHWDVLKSCEEDWQKRLEGLSNENVKTLLSISEKSQTIIPAITSSVQELTSFEELLESYSTKVDSIGQDLREIEYNNNLMAVQNFNLQTTYEYIEKIINHFEAFTTEMNQILETKPFEDSNNLLPLTEASTILYNTIKNSDQLPNISACINKRAELEAAQEKFYARLGLFFTTHLEKLSQETKKSILHLPSLDILCKFISKYSSLIEYMEKASSKSHSDLIKLFLLSLQGVFKRDMMYLCETIKSLIGNPDRNYLFLFPQIKKPMIDLNLRKKVTSTKRFSEAPLVGSQPPKLEFDEVVSSVQAFEYVLLTLISGTIKIQEVARSAIVKDKKQQKRFLSNLENLLSEIDPFIKSFAESLIKMDPGIPIELWSIVNIRYRQLFEECSTVTKLIENLSSFLRVCSERFIDQQVFYFFNLPDKWNTGGPIQREKKIRPLLIRGYFSKIYPPLFRV